ncbi:MAG: hypothetical protein RMY28_005845 [Nostoc sp. ChiSLP01]|nr:hypothetical protein [Nostoc sp. CmiSLP01]MDZ8283115.1 hypothetical protein [Nostoc sp. ChiSLP01]
MSVFKAGGRKEAEGRRQEAEGRREAEGKTLYSKVNSINEFTPAVGFDSLLYERLRQRLCSGQVAQPTS